MPTGPILVTGGTGYLGRHLVAALGRRGPGVRVLARDPARAAGFTGAGVEVVPGDVTDRASLDAACRGVSAVVHAAAMVRSWARDRRAFEAVNVHGLRNAVLAAAGAGARRFLFVSSFFALGPTDGITGDETLPPDPRRRFHNEYERTKTLAEAEARELAAQGHPLVTVYPGVLFGPGVLTEGNLVAGMLVEAAAGRLPGLPGGGDRRWCFTYVEDAAEGAALALERASPGDRLVLGGENATLREFFDLVEACGGPRVPRRSIPYAAASAAGALREFLAALGGPRPKVTRGAVGIFRHEWAYSSRRAERALGWRARPLREGVVATLASLRAEGRIR